MQKWLLSFLLIFSVPSLATPTANVTDLASLQQQLSQHEIVRGDFTQQRHLEMFSQPLTSKGQFTLSKTHGLLWQQAEPFAVNLVLTENKLRQTFADQAPKTISAQENPMA
ncbi:MAG: hypothetical protein C0632_06795, partial [Vibrio alginolyticus]